MRFIDNQLIKYEIFHFYDKGTSINYGRGKYGFSQLFPVGQSFENE